MVAHMYKKSAGNFYLHFWRSPDIFMPFLGTGLRLKKALEITFEVSKLVKYSSKRDVMFEKLKDKLALDTPGFRVLCPTQWTVRANSLQSVLDNYSALQEYIPTLRMLT